MFRVISIVFLATFALYYIESQDIIQDSRYKFAVFCAIGLCIPPVIVLLTPKEKKEKMISFKKLVDPKTLPPKLKGINSAHIQLARKVYGTRSRDKKKKELD